MSDVDIIVEQTKQARTALIKEVADGIYKAEDGTLPSMIEPAFALGLSVPNWSKLLPWGRVFEEAIRKHRGESKAR